MPEPSPPRVETSRPLALLALILVALNLRPAIAMIGPLLEPMQAELALTHRGVGLLTSLPTLAMGLFAFGGGWLISHLGLRCTGRLALLLLAAATLLRWQAHSAALLLATALAAGAGIAVVQVVLPAYLQARFARRLAGTMGLYTAAVILGAGGSAALAPWLAAAFGSWRAALALAAVPVLAGLAAWQRAAPLAMPPAPYDAPINGVSWRAALGFGAFFAMGTSLYTALLAWLAPIYMDAGFTAQQAGLAVLGFTLAGAAGALLLPLLSAPADRRGALGIAFLLVGAGLTGMLLAPRELPWLWLALTGAGVGGIFPLSMVLPLDAIAEPAHAAPLMARALGVGYTLAAPAPWLVGLLRDRLGGFDIALLGLLALVGLMAVISRALRPTPAAISMPPQRDRRERERA